MFRPSSASAPLRLLSQVRQALSLALQAVLEAGDLRRPRSGSAPQAGVSSATRGLPATAVRPQPAPRGSDRARRLVYMPPLAGTSF